MASDMVLYIALGSPAALRAQIMLKEKDLQAYQENVISFSKMEHKSEDYVRLNPRSQVPSFRHGDIAINDSAAICDYLETRYHNQGTKLMPDDPTQMAQVKQRVYESGSLVQKQVEDLLHIYFNTKPEDMDLELVRARKKAYVAELGLWESYLKAQGEGGYLAGQEITLADVLVYPYIAIATRMGLKLQPNLPYMASWYDRMTARPSVQASWPPHWKGEGQSFLSDIFTQ